MAKFQNYTFPASLFRYRSGKDIAREISTLEENGLYFSNIFAQNDSAEGFYKLNFLGNEMDRGEFIENLRNNKQNIGVCCLTDNLASAPFWGNYANEASGFCIEFDTALLTKNLDGAISLVRIYYRDKAPEINASSPYPAKNTAKEIISCKHKSWQHESEWRFIKDGIGTASYKNSKCTKSIQIGRYIPTSLRNSLRKFSEANGVPLISMQLTGYQISFS